MVELVVDGVDGQDGRLTAKIHARHAPRRVLDVRQHRPDILHHVPPPPPRFPLRPQPQRLEHRVRVQVEARRHLQGLHHLARPPPVQQRLRGRLPLHAHQLPAQAPAQPHVGLEDEQAAVVAGAGQGAAWPGLLCVVVGGGGVVSGSIGLVVGLGWWSASGFVSTYKVRTAADGHVRAEERAEAEAGVAARISGPVFRAVVVAAEEEAEHVGAALLVDHSQCGGGPPGRLRHGPVSGLVG